MVETLTLSVLAIFLMEYVARHVTMSTMTSATIVQVCVTAIPGFAVRNQAQTHRIAVQLTTTEIVSQREIFHEHITNICSGRSGMFS